MFLQRMREKTQSWVAYIIVGLLILSFAFFGISSYFNGSSSDQPVAVVDGEKISASLLMNTYHQSLTETPHNTTKRWVLDQLIQRLAIQHYIAHLGFAVNQDQMDAALMSVPLFSVQGAFSPALFKRFLAAHHMSAQQFLVDFSIRMKMAQWEEGISMTSFSTPLELDNIIALLKQKRTILYGIIKDSAQDLTPITSAAAQKFYNQHPQDFTLPESVKIAYITVSMADVARSIQPSSATLLEYYAQHSAHFNVPERWQVNVVVLDSKAKKDLAPQPQGVWLTADNLSPEVKNALLHTAVKATTPAFKVGDSHYMAYTVLKHQPAITRQYYQVKAAVLDAYRKQEASQRWGQLLEKMSNLAYEHPESLDILHKKLNRPIKTSTFFTQDYNGKSGIQGRADIITAAFSEDVLSGGNNSEVIHLDQGKTACVLRVIDHISSHTQSFTEAEAGIKKILRRQQVQQHTKKIAQQVQQALVDKEDVEKIQQKYGVILSQQTIGRFDHHLPSDILQQAFILPLYHAGVTAVGETSFAAVQVLKIIPGEPSAVTKKERAMYKSVVTNEWAQAEIAAEVRAIMAQAHIKINQAALDATPA